MATYHASVKKALTASSRTSSTTKSIALPTP